MLPVDVLEAPTLSFHVGPNYVGFILIVTIRVLVDVIVLGSIVLLTSNACPVQSPCWVLKIAKCFVEVIFFPLKELLVGTDCPSPVFKGVDNTILGRQEMVTVPMQVQICVCGLSVY